MGPADRPGAGAPIEVAAEAALEPAYVEAVTEPAIAAAAARLARGLTL